MLPSHGNGIVDTYANVDSLSERANLANVWHRFGEEIRTGLGVKERRTVTRHDGINGETALAKILREAAILDKILAA
jgi:hypothetical protein